MEEAKVWNVMKLVGGWYVENDGDVKEETGMANKNMSSEELKGQEAHDVGFCFC